MKRLFSILIMVLSMAVLLASCGGGGGGGGGGAPTLASIAVTPAAPSIATGATQQFMATGIYSDGSTTDLTSTATWNSSDPAQATVNAAGLATAAFNAAGSATISAASDSVSGSAVLKVIVNLPKTGQTASSAAGDDGALQMGVAWPNPRFTVGTSAEADCVTDNLTGLMWAKNANLPAGSKTWQQALTYVGSLNSPSGLCGHKDWRLPNRKELKSLIDKSKYAPALSAGHPFINVQAAAAVYWSSTTYAGDTNLAWIVSMEAGLVVNDNKFHYDYVWPVRSGQGSSAPANLPKTGQSTAFGPGDDGALRNGVAWPNPRFTVGTGAEADCATDNLTGLMWVKNANLPAGTKTRQEALGYAAMLNSGAGLCGHNDWRLPNDIELESLADSSASNPALPAGHPFANVQTSYWSSTTHAGDTSLAWWIVMGDGSVRFDPAYGHNFAWPVRGGQ